MQGMLNYSQAVKHVMTKGNYPLLFKVISYVFVVLILFNVLMAFSDCNVGETGFLIIRITVITILSIGFLYYLKAKKVQIQNIIFYEIILAFCFPICQSVTLFNSISILYLYGAVIVGGLFYGLLSGYFLIPVVMSPVLYFLSFQLSLLLVHKNLSISANATIGIFIVMWFSAIATSAARIGFDVFYFLRIAFHEQTLQLESVKILKDSTEQKLLLETELSKLKGVEYLGLYAGGIAHDFNNMLTIIAGQMMSLRRTATDDLERKSIESIMQAVKKTSGLIKKLLLFTGQYESHRQVFILNELVESTIELLKHSADKKIDIEYYVTNDSAQIHGDSNLFQTSLISFLFNVLKGLKVESTLNINLLVLDQYQSASPGNFRLETVSIEKIAVLTIRGALQIDQTWQKNETFIELMGVVNAMSGKLITGNEILQINLPLRIVQSSEQGQKSNPEKSTKEILVVDDEEMVLKSTEEVLLSAGYRVISCSNAESAINAFKRRHKEIGLVLLDMRMPDKSGKELYFDLKKIDPKLKVIIVSGYCSDKDVQEMLDDGVLKYIQKPYSEEMLCTIVASSI
jgi:CheY-like chemotaxis protein